MFPRLSSLQENAQKIRRTPSMRSKKEKQNKETIIEHELLSNGNSDDPNVDHLLRPTCQGRTTQKNSVQESDKLQTMGEISPDHHSKKKSKTFPDIQVERQKIAEEAPSIPVTLSKASKRAKVTPAFDTSVFVEYSKTSPPDPCEDLTHYCK